VLSLYRFKLVSTHPCDRGAVTHGSWHVDAGEGVEALAAEKMNRAAGRRRGAAVS